MIYIILIKHRESGEVEVVREAFLSYRNALDWCKLKNDKPVQMDIYTFISSLCEYRIVEAKIRR